MMPMGVLTAAEMPSEWGMTSTKMVNVFTHQNSGLQAAPNAHTDRAAHRPRESVEMFVHLAAQGECEWSRQLR